MYVNNEDPIETYIEITCIIWGNALYLTGGCPKHLFLHSLWATISLETLNSWSIWYSNWINTYSHPSALILLQCIHSNATPTRDAGRKTADLHLFLFHSKYNSPVLKHNPCFNLHWSQYSHLQWIRQVFRDKPPSPHPLLSSIPQPQLTFPGNPQDTLTMEAGRLTTDLYLFLHCSKTNLPDLHHHQTCDRPSGIASHFIHWPQSQRAKKIIIEQPDFLPPVNILSTAPCQCVPTPKCLFPIPRNTF